MRLPQMLLLSAAIAITASACGSSSADVERTQEALEAVVADIEAVDGVQEVSHLGPDESTGFTSATTVVGSLTLEPDVDQAGAERIVEQVGELVWRSDAPAISALFVRSSGQGFEGHVSLDDVLDDTTRDGLRAHFGERG